MDNDAQEGRRGRKRLLLEISVKGKKSKEESP
jgi:hypothetical protein